MGFGDGESATDDALEVPALLPHVIRRADPEGGSEYELAGRALEIP